MQFSLLFRRFGSLLLTTAALTLVLVFVGVVVRATGSGLGCGTAGGWHDWPLCHGRLIPPATLDSIIEFSHRACAAVVSLCLLGAAGWSWTNPELRRNFGGGMAFAVGLLILQITLGALTVRLLDENTINPAFVVAHLATAFTFFGTMVAFGLHARRLAKGGDQPLPEYSSGLRYFTLITASAILFQAIIGGLVANLGASMACPEFPACAGGVWIPALTGPIGIQVIHRLAAVIVTILVATLAFKAREQAGFRALANTAVVLVLVQFTLGVLTVLLGLPLMARAAHHVTAYALFGTAVALGYIVFAGRLGSRSAPDTAVAAMG